MRVAATSRCVAGYFGSGAQPIYYGLDGHGNVAFLSAADGSVSDVYRYDAWGNVVASSGNTVNRRLFNGEDFDAALGLSYFRARYYDPARGRFRTIDPASGAQNAPITWNRYVFADGDPVNLADPRGLEAEEYAYILNATKGIGAVAENFLKTVQQTTASGTGEVDKLLTQTAQFYRNAGADFDKGFSRDYGEAIGLGFFTACEFEIVAAGFDYGSTGAIGDPGVCIPKSPYPNGPGPIPLPPNFPPFPGLNGL